MADEAGEQRPSPADAQVPADLAALQRQLLHAQELLAELRRQRDQLEAQVEAQQRQIEQNAAERTELRRLLAGPAARLSEQQRAEMEGLALGSRVTSPVSSWREGKRGLGASLTLTGVVALAAGIILHFALQQRFIVSAAHLGYIIGLVGLLTFLLGLLLVY